VDCDSPIIEGGKLPPRDRLEEIDAEISAQVRELKEIREATEKLEEEWSKKNDDCDRKQREWLDHFKNRYR